MSPAVFFITAYLVVVAMLVGSFINLAADRLPRGESLVWPRSHCRACGRTLNAIDLLPVVGYVVRGGRCATCGVPIGAGSPLVEAVAGGCVAGAIALGGLWPGAAAGFALVALGGLALVGYAMRRDRPETAASIGS